MVLHPKEAEPDYAPRQVESNAQSVDDGGSKLSQPEGGGAVSLTYSNEVTLILANKTVQLFFRNPALSGVDVAGRPPGTYEGKFHVMYYDAHSGEKAIINTEIPITVTVKA